MFRSLVFFIVAVLSVPCSDPVSAQTSNYLDTTRSSARTGSSEAKAESKRLYKEGVKYGLAKLYAQAAQMFEQAVKLDPQHADAHFALGHAYFDMQQWKNAIRGFERAYELNPKDDQARDMLVLARTMAHQGPPPSNKPRVQSPPNAESVQVSMSVNPPAPAPAKTENPAGTKEANTPNGESSRC